MHPLSRSPRRPISRTLARTATAALTGLATLAAGLVLAAPADAGNRVTPGSFTGYGFDQCTAPTQKAMDAWLTSSPYWAVGIYISGDSRACTSQPNLSPTWVGTQLANGWRLLPITLGPQASCTTRERYLHQVRINPSPAGSYAAARSQGRAEAAKTIGAAQVARHLARQHAVVRHRGLRDLQDRLPRVRADVPVRVDRAAARPGLRLRRLLQRRLRQQDPRRRPGHPPRRARDARPPLDRRLERPRRHRVELPPLRRLDPAPPGAPVPRRAQRDVRRRDDQHRHELGRRRAWLDDRRGAEALRRRGVVQLPALLHPPRREHRRAGEHRPVPAEGQGLLRRPRRRRVRRRGVRRRPPVPRGDAAARRRHGRPAGVGLAAVPWRRRRC